MLDKYRHYGEENLGIGRGNPDFGHRNFDDFFHWKFRSGSVPVNFRALKFRFASGSGQNFDSGRTLLKGWQSCPSANGVIPDSLLDHEVNDPPCTSVNDPMKYRGSNLTTRGEMGGWVKWVVGVKWDVGVMVGLKHLPHFWSHFWSHF